MRKLWPRILFALLLATVAGLLCGCSPGCCAPAKPIGPHPVSTGLPPGCSSADPPLPPEYGAGSCVQPLTLTHSTGGVTHNDMPRNGLSIAALSGARNLLDFLRTSPLRSQSFAAMPAAAQAELQAPGSTTPELVQYIVSCALDPRPAEDVAIGGGTTLHGELGLCGANSPLGDWARHKPTPACLEAVSGCLFARVNALHRKVVISTRTTPDCLLPFAPRVPVETRYRDTDGTVEIDSFTACVGPQNGADRNCGWTAQLVGVCTPGSLVTVQPTVPGTLARVCVGLHGCNTSADPQNTTGSVQPPRSSYSRIMPMQANAANSFTCPAGASNEATPTGYFSVMLAPASSTDALPAGADVTVSSVSPVSYPATEQQVFTFPEGAFYGNLFDDAQVCGASTSPGGAYSAEEHACYSSVWSFGRAYLADRLCDTPGQGCATSPFDCSANNPPAPCTVPSVNDPCVTGNSPPPNPRCTSQPPAVEPPSLYPACTGNAPGHRFRAITVFLNDPCDLVGSTKDCFTHAK